MRIVLVHSRYRSRQPSGENIVVEIQAEALRTAGHEVLVITADSDDIAPGLSAKLSMVKDVAMGSGIDPTKTILEFAPDVVHVHNLFPNFSTKWLSSLEIPIVATLHNFRYSCAAGTFHRAGNSCTLCIGGNTAHAVLKKCYRDSRFASVPMAIRSWGGAPNDALLTASTILVCLSERSLEIHAKAGVSRSKMSILPNFSPVSPGRSEGSGSWLYVGRLTEEKGIMQLLEGWPTDLPLRILGEGPLRPLVEKVSSERPMVDYGGKVSGAEVHQAMVQSRGLLFPSRWAESATPMSYVEAMAAGLPTIALAGNGAADDVELGGTGVVVKNWSEVGRALSEVDRNWQIMSDSAVARHRQLFSQDAWARGAHALYERAVSISRS